MIPNTSLNVSSSRLVQSDSSRKTSRILKPISKDRSPSKRNFKKNVKQQQKFRSNTSLNSHQNALSNMKAIRYKSYETVRYNKEYNMFEETDQTFYKDVKKVNIQHNDIMGVKNILSLVDKEKQIQITDRQFDQIDFVARKHYKANCINDSQSKQDFTYDQCPCGCGKYCGEKIPFCTSFRQLNFLGAGNLLIFTFLYTFSIVMFIILLVYGVFAITTNLLGGQSQASSDCSEDDGWCRLINNSANDNKINPSYYMIIQWWLGVGLTVVWLIFTRVVKDEGRRMNKDIDQHLESASDKAVIIKNLPPKQFTQIELMDYFQNLWLKLSREKQIKTMDKDIEVEPKQMYESKKQNLNKFNVQSIQIVYSMQFARKVNKRMIDLCRQLFYDLEQNFNDQSLDDTSIPRKLLKNVDKYKQTKLQLIKLLQSMGDLRKKFLYDQAFRQNLSGILCIVEFKSEQNKNQLLDSFGKQKMGFITQITQSIKKKIFGGQRKRPLKLKGKSLQIQRAPEPSDILWQKCELPYSKANTFGLYMLTIVIVAFSLGLVSIVEYLIQFVNQKVDEGLLSEDSLILTVINFGTSLVLMGVNQFLWYILSYLIQLEVNHTCSEKIISRMNKALFATSVNIILLPLISCYLIKERIYTQRGLTANVYEYQISTLLVGLPTKLFNPVQTVKRIILYVRYTRNKFIKRMCKDYYNIDQLKNGVKKINELYQGEEFDVAQSYVYIMATIYHLAFFCQVQPVVLITGPLIITGFYFVLKANLFYFCKSPDMLDLSVFEAAMTQACLVPLFYGAGAMTLTYIDNQLDPQRPVEYLQAIICMGLSLLFFFNPGGIFHMLSDSLDSLADMIKLTKAQKKSSEMQRNSDTYYNESNSLQLFGFEKVVKGKDLDQSIQNQLKRFCTKFIPKPSQTLAQDQNHQNQT